MRKIVLLLTLFATALACLLHAVPAQAQPIRVFVALTGADANPCTFASPCKSVQHAHDVVAAGGEVRMLDQGSYGLLTITKSISILGDGHGGIAASNGATAITINAGATDKINLRGLVVEGFGTGNFGINFNTGASLNIQDSIIRNFTSFGIFFTASTASQLNVSRTLVSDLASGGDAVVIRATAGPGNLPVLAVLDHVVLDQSHNGLLVTGFSDQVAQVTITDSVISNQSNVGIFGQSGGAAIDVMVRNCSVTNNATGISTSGSGVFVRVTRSTITANGIGLTSGGSTNLVSYGDNNLDGNTSDGVPTSTLALR